MVNAVSGEPVKKVRLFLKRIGNGVPYATTTDSAGHFLIDEVDAGRYSLTASRAGFPDQVYSPHGGKAERGSMLELAAGQDLKEMVFKLVPNAVIAGRVLDEDGDPLANVQLDCMKLVYSQGKRQLVEQASIFTNEVGEFRLVLEWARKCVIKATRPPPDAYALVAERPVAASRARIRAGDERFATTYYPNTTNPDNASVLDVPAGAKISGINLTLLRTRTVQIKGHVTIAFVACGTQTNVFLAQGNRFWTTNRAPVDPKGRFEMNGVLPGSYFLDAGCRLEEKSYYARIPVEVRDANIEGIELTLQPMPGIHGHVILESKLKGAKPRLSIHSGINQLVHLKDDLGFNFDSLPPGSYEFGPEGNPENVYIKSVHTGDRDITDSGLDLAPGAAPEEITVVLSPNAGIVEGSVKNAKDDPVAGALITLIPEGSSFRRHKTATTDQNGHFIVKGAIPGDYKIYAWEDIEENAYEDPDYMKPHEADGEAVSIKESGHETVQLKLIPAETNPGARPAQ